MLQNCICYYIVFIIFFIIFPSYFPLYECPKTIAKNIFCIEYAKIYLEVESYAL